MQVVYHILSHQMMKNLLSGCYFYVCILFNFFHDDTFALGKTSKVGTHVLPLGMCQLI